MNYIGNNKFEIFSKGKSTILRASNLGFIAGGTGIAPIY